MHCHLFIFTLLTLTLLQVVHAVNQLNIDSERTEFRVQTEAVVDYDDPSATHVFKADFSIEDDIIPSRHPTSNRNRRSKRVRRSARISSTHDFRWPNGIVPYTISSNFTEKESCMITGAMQRIQNVSCVEFAEHSTEPDYVRISRDNTGRCLSHIGREGGHQELRLGNGCLHNKIILHELMHTLGFEHEHNRPDRDEYIKVYWDNIEPGAEKNFWKESSADMDTLDTSYDYFSIMHYNEKGFSRNNGQTLGARSKIKRLLGDSKRRTLTVGDKARINRLYCPSVNFSKSWLLPDQRSV